MRELTSHKVNGLNEVLRIKVLDEPGQGGACHVYQIEWEQIDTDGQAKPALCRIAFQNGPIQEHGVNGISNEALLAIVEDRLAGFQSGEFACDENGVALAWIRKAMALLKLRTRDRIDRGVEGTNQA